MFPVKYADQDVRISKNPTNRQFLTLLAQSKHDLLRGFLTDTDEFLVWDAAKAAHAAFLYAKRYSHAVESLF
jgi:hypothetical protein